MLRARDAGGWRSALIVHLADRPRSYEFAGLLPEADGYAALRRIAGGKDGQLATTSYKGVVEFDGLGVAMVMTDVMAAG